MPYVLEDLVIDRVDLVEEGANSAAFIEFFKRKESKMDFSEILSKMKPEHASVIQQQLDDVTEELTKAKQTIEADATTLTEANEALAKANAELETLKAKECTCDGEADDKGMCKACGKPKKAKTEEDVLKAMPEAARELFTKMREQKEAAEAQIRKAADEKATAEAIVKATTMKSLPIEQDALVDIIKNSDTKVIELLQAASNAIDTAVLGEVGKSHQATANLDAWSKIEAKADEIAKRDSITKQKAVAIAIKENPEMYREYLNGGAN